MALCTFLTTNAEVRNSEPSRAVPPLAQGGRSGRDLRGGCAVLVPALILGGRIGVIYCVYYQTPEFKTTQDCQDIRGEWSLTAETN